MKPLSVSEITSQIKMTLGAHFEYVCVEGEVSKVTKHSSGHTYFDLKDEKAVIRCVLFLNAAKRGKELLEYGAKVEVSGKVDVYAPQGNYQIICTSISKSGIGELAQKYEELKKKLHAQGYFDARFKKKLPPFPRKIALLTSKTGAVINDMLKVASTRWNCDFILINTIVQGSEAKNSIAKNIAYADTLNVDIIVLARGGGSLEDLWAFNEKLVADAIFRAKTPIVSAIGHEPDVVLSDFVADLRAPTPSACMEIILPDKNEWMLKLDDFYDELHLAQKKALQRHQNTLNALKDSLSLFKLNYNPRDLAQMRESLNDMFAQYLRRKFESLSLLNMRAAGDEFLGKKCAKIINLDELNLALQNNLARKNKQLAHLSEILSVQKLKSGLAQITKDGKIIALASLQSGDLITLCDGNTQKDAQIK